MKKLSPDAKREVESKVTDPDREISEVKSENKSFKKIPVKEKPVEITSRPEM